MQFERQKFEIPCISKDKYFYLLMHLGRQKLQSTNAVRKTKVRNNLQFERQILLSSNLMSLSNVRFDLRTNLKWRTSVSYSMTLNCNGMCSQLHEKVGTWKTAFDYTGPHAQIRNNGIKTIQFKNLQIGTLLRKVCCASQSMLCFAKLVRYTSHFVKITMLAICKIYTPQKSRSFIISELKLRYPLVHCFRTSTVFLTRIDLLHFLSLACVPMAKELYLIIPWAFSC